MLASQLLPSSESWTLTASDEEKHPARTDRTFTWERDAWRIGEAIERRWVEIQGDTVGGFAAYLHVPDAWHRAQEEKEAPRNLLSTIAWSLHSLVGFLEIGCLIYFGWKRELRPKFAIVVGIVIASLGVLAELNAFPLIWWGYETTESYEAFLTDWLISLGLSFFGNLFEIVLVTLAAEALYRKVFPNRVAISHALERKFWFSREFATGSAAGFMLGGISLGYVTLFYLAAHALGAWSPMQIPYENTISTAIPWIYPLLVGAHPAIDEEFMYRAFAISLFLLAVGKRPGGRAIAVVIPAVIWAFLHVNYPQEPFFIRGVELTVVGVLYGVVMIRYGIVATVVSHYTLNAVLSSTLLLRADHPYLRISGVLICLLAILPVLPALVFRIRGGKFFSSDVFAAAPEKERRYLIGRVSPPPFVYQPFSFRAIILILLSCLAVAAVSISREKPYIAVTVNRTEAIETADDHMRALGNDPEAWTRSARFWDWREGDKEFLDEAVTPAQRDAIFDELESARWHVRYVKPLTEESYYILVDRDGDIFSWWRILPEDASGAQLTESAALRLAEDDLRARGHDAGDWELVDKNSTEHENRTDHWFAWEDRNNPIGDAYRRYSVTVQGDQVMSFFPSLEISDKWHREKARRLFIDALFEGIGMALGLVVALFIAALAGICWTSGQARWKLSAIVGAIAVLLAVVASLNNLSMFWFGYPTAQPPAFFLATYALSQIGGWLGIFVGTVLAVSFIDAFFRVNFPNYFQDLMRTDKSLLWRDALVATAVVSAPLPIEYLLDENPLPEIFGGAETFLPMLSLFEGVAALGAIFVIAFFAAFHVRFLRRPWKAFALLAIVFALTIEEFNVFEVTRMVGVFFLVWWLVRYIFRGNVYAYALTLVVDILIDNAHALLATPDGFTQWNGVVVIAVLIAVLSIAAWNARPRFSS